MPLPGGPFSWLDILGAAHATEICDRLAVEHGSRFDTPHVLRELAINGETFCGRFDADTAEAA